MNIFANQMKVPYIINLFLTYWGKLGVGDLLYMEWKNGKVAKTIVAPKSHEDRYS
jgi:hypothetical protein